MRKLVEFYKQEIDIDFMALEDLVADMLALRRVPVKCLTILYDKKEYQLIIKVRTRGRYETNSVLSILALREFTGPQEDYFEALVKSMAAALMHEDPEAPLKLIRENLWNVRDAIFQLSRTVSYHAGHEAMKARDSVEKVLKLLR